MIGNMGSRTGAATAAQPVRRAEVGDFGAVHG